MELLHWELSVLSRAIAYKNLSGASQHIGVSQPQLSRIISKLETEFKVTLLDRTSKRKSSWTQTALELATHYSKHNQKLNHDLQKLIKGSQPTHIKIGTLEGFISLALRLSNQLLNKNSIQTLELHVHDLNLLDEYFYKGEFDFIFTSIEPGKSKFKYSKILGHQSLDKIEKGNNPQVMSSFEYGFQFHKYKEDTNKKIFVSNSLEVRKRWIELYGGSGILPSEVKKKKLSQKDTESIFLIAPDNLSPMLWDAVKDFKI